VRLNQLLSVSSRLWVGGRWYSNATLRAYVDKDRLDDIKVGNLGTSESRELEPNNEQRLESEIPRDVIKDNTKGEGLKEVEEAKDNPISEPLDIVVW